MGTSPGCGRGRGASWRSEWNSLSETEEWWNVTLSVGLRLTVQLQRDFRAAKDMEALPGFVWDRTVHRLSAPPDAWEAAEKVSRTDSLTSHLPSTSSVLPTGLTAVYQCPRSQLIVLVAHGPVQIPKDPPPVLRPPHPPVPSRDPAQSSSNKYEQRWSTTLVPRQLDGLGEQQHAVPGGIWV